MIIYNRQFRRDYQSLDDFEAGVVLTGAEVKSIRAGDIRLEGAFAKLINQELFIFNLQISKYSKDSGKQVDTSRMRKLLVHKKQIYKLQAKLASNQRLTLIPISCYFSGRRVKIKLALAKGRLNTEKRKLEKQRDLVNQRQRELKRNF